MTGGTLPMTETEAGAMTDGGSGHVGPERERGPAAADRAASGDAGLEREDDRATTDDASGGSRMTPWLVARCRVLAAVPFRLGHHPAGGSVVVVGLAGPDPAPPRLVARTDRAVLDSVTGAVVARSIAAHLVTMGCERVLVVHYDPPAADPRPFGCPPDGSRPSRRGEDRPRPSDSPPDAPRPSARCQSDPCRADRGPDDTRREAIDALIAAACTDVGVSWDSAWIVDDIGARHVSGTHGTTHHPGVGSGRISRQELDARVAAAARMAGWIPAARRADIGQIAPAGHHDRRAAAEARSRWLHRRPTPDAEASAWGEWQRRSLLRWQDVRTRPDAIARTTLGRIEAGLSDPLVVEASAITMLLPELAPDLVEQVCRAALAVPDIPIPVVVPVAPPDPGQARRTRAVPEAETGAEGAQPWSIRPWFARQMAAGALRPPESAVDAARLLLERVVAHGRDGRQSGALTLLALMAWWVGDGVRGSVLVERALAQDRIDPLAVQVNWVLAAGALPGWARPCGVTSG